MQEPADMVVRPAIKHVPRSVVRDAHQRIVRCGLGIVPVSSETEDKFEDAMEVTASSPLREIARVLVRFNHLANFIIKHVHKSSMTSWPDRLSSAAQKRILRDPVKRPVLRIECRMDQSHYFDSECISSSRGYLAKTMVRNTRTTVKKAVTIANHLIRRESPSRLLRAVSCRLRVSSSR
jgi:hypothetical protein